MIGMRADEIVGYAWWADMHCPPCTQKALEDGTLRRDDTHPHARTGRDEHGLALDIVDPEWNIITPVFAVSEDAAGQHCAECGTKLVEDGE